MAEKKWVIILAVLDVLVVGSLVFWYVKQDRDMPVISLKETFLYEENMSDAEVLSHLKAIDSKDGDVSHTLVVEKIGPDATGQQALITCGARDEAGNMAKYSFYTACGEDVFVTETSHENNRDEIHLAVGEAEILDAETTSDATSEEESSEDGDGDEANNEDDENVEGNSDDENDGVDPDGNNVDADNVDDENADENDDADSDNEDNNPEAGDNHENNTPQEAQPTPTPAAHEQAATAASRPVIQFSTTEVKTIQGRNPAWVTVISQMTDDVDSYETLLQSLTISGDYNNAVPGSYDVSVTVTDSEGNVSAPSRIRIVVE